MKKLLFCGAAAAIIAGCGTKTETVQVMDATCDKVITFEQGDMIVKCPITEGLTMIQAQPANSKFVQGQGFDFTNAIADAEHVYVNVIPAGSYDFADKTQYRVMVRDANMEADAWAVALVIE